MSTQHQKYCLDANVLIRAWEDYYAPKFCIDYWGVLNELGAKDRIFLPEMVYEEITRTDDDLTKWLKKSKIPTYKIDVPVIECLKKIYATNPAHKNLVDNIKNRSLADPWVIAHALDQGAIVVTKEGKIDSAKSTKVRIPNVCDNMGVRWINDFQFVEELNIQFSCHIP